MFFYTYHFDNGRSFLVFQVLQKLDHKNVMKLQELINDSNELLMVMEYMPENVKRVMKKR